MASLRALCGQAPLVLQWPLLYANNELAGQGTLLRVSGAECHVAGTMPVASGMVMQVWIFPPNRNDALYVREARVLWAQTNEFALELRELDHKDHQWLMRFFKACGHRFRQARA